MHTSSPGRMAGKKTFYCAGVVDPSSHYVIDRTEWHNRMADALAKGCYKLLHAPRQSGKTSAAAAVRRILLADDAAKFLVVACAVQSMLTATAIEAWRSLEVEVHIALQSCRSDKHFSAVPDAKKAAIGASDPLFTNMESFKLFWTGWGEIRVLLILDEFDKILLAPQAVKDEFLGVLRDVKTARSMAPTAPSSALHSVLAIGVHRILQLAVEKRTEVASQLSPFNVSDAETVPRATLDGVTAVINEALGDYGAKVDDAVIEDLFVQSGGHVGMISLLGSELLSLCGSGADKPLSAEEWFTFCSGAYLFSVLYRSATVAAMLQAVGAQRAGNPVVAGARKLLRYILSTPQDQLFDVSANDESLLYLISEGVVCETTPTRKGRLEVHTSSPILIPLLQEAVGSNARVQAMPSLSFPLVPATSLVDLRRTVLEVLPFLNMEELHYPLLLLKDGAPCEYAYHFALKDLLHHRATNSGWRVYGETRNAAVAKKKTGLRRLDILVASNGTRCGVELLAEGDGLDGHVFEQTPQYIKLQSLRNALVVNFCTRRENIAEKLGKKPDVAVDVLQIFVDRAKKTYTPYVLHEDRQTFTALSEIAEVTTSEIDDLTEATKTWSIGSGAGAMPAPAAAKAICVDDTVEYMLTGEINTVATLLAAVKEDFPQAESPTFLRKNAENGKWYKQSGNLLIIASTFPDAEYAVRPFASATELLTCSFVF